MRGKGVNENGEAWELNWEGRNGVGKEERTIYYQCEPK